MEINGKSATVHNPSIFLSQLVNTASSKTCLVMGDMHPQPAIDITWPDPGDLEDYSEEQCDALTDTTDDISK